MNPASLKPRRNAATICLESLRDLLSRNPTTGIAGCCACATMGHAAAAPPSSVITWRRLTSGMGSPSEPAVPAYRTPRLPGRYRQVLGADLNCSEPRCCGAPPHSGRWSVRVQTRFGSMSGTWPGPASSLSEKVSFNRINRQTGKRRFRNRRGRPAGGHGARGYEVAKGRYMIVEDEEIEA